MERNVAFILLSCCLLGVASASYGSLLNPGFDGDGSAPSGDGWTFYGTDAAVWDSTTRSAPGAATMYIGWQGYAGVYQDCSASAGQLWEAQAWARSNADDTIKGSGARAGMNLEFYNASNERLLCETTFVLLGSDPNMPESTWVNGTAQATAPEGTSFVRLALYLDRDGSSYGRVYYDDASLEVVPEPTTMGLLAVGGLALIRRRRH